MKTLLITRPEEEAEPLASALATLGFQTFAEPLLRVEVSTENTLALKKALARNPQAILITSRQGLKALARMTATRSTPLLCVGSATAEYAATLGFIHIHPCETAQALPDLVRGHCAPGPAPLLYARGEHISADIAAMLGGMGFHVDSVILYRAIAAEEFSETLRSLIAGKKLSGALFFSARTAEIYTSLVTKHMLGEAHGDMGALCISENVAARLGTLPWHSVHAAAKPDMQHMLEAVAKVF